MFINSQNTKAIVLLALGEKEAELDRNYYYISTKVQTQFLILTATRIVQYGSLTLVLGSLATAGIAYYGGMLMAMPTGGLVVVPLSGVATVAVAASGVLTLASVALSAVGDNAEGNINRDSEKIKQISGLNNPLLERWGDGGRGSSYNNADYHYGEHGGKVSAKGFDDYLRKADAWFRNNVLTGKAKLSHLVSGQTPDVYRYTYNQKHIDLQHIYGQDFFGNPKIIDYKIISFGMQ